MESKNSKNRMVLLVFWFAVILAFDNNGVGEKPSFSLSSSVSFDDFFPDSRHTDGFQSFELRRSTELEYNFYRTTCPKAENIISSTMSDIYSEHQDVSAALLRLLFHDCFIQGCDASILLDDSNGNQSHKIEKQAIPNRTLKGFDKIDMIKEVLEKACPGVVSCADILVLATRDGIVLAGGPFYPVSTGRRDSLQSFYEESLNQIPKPDGNISQTLSLFAIRGLDERDTVSLLGGHNIGQIGCQFIENRLNNFMGTGKPDPDIASDFLDQLRFKCNISINDESPQSMRLRNLVQSIPGMTYYQGLSASLSSGAGFDSHYYASLLRGRGLLFADQQLMSNEMTASLVKTYASDDGSTFRADFARAMMKLSDLDVLTGTEGQIRLNCSLPLKSN